MDSRQIFAALANPDTRAMYARVTLARVPPEPTSREMRALESLLRAGLIHADDGVYSPSDVFRDLLAQGRSPGPRGYEKFLEHDRVVRWPSKSKDKDGLIRWIMNRSLNEGESLTENALNERLRQYSDDPALIRRHCVDRGYIRRTRDGSRYYR